MKLNMKESVRGDVTNRTEDNILKQDKTSIKGKRKQTIII